MSVTLTWWLLAGVTATGAVAVVAARELTRLMLGLGLFLLGVAGLYAWHGFGLLAVAQLFVYVGGVLVLFLFAITSLGRSGESRDLTPRFRLPAAALSVGLAVLIVTALRTAPAGAPAGTAQVGDTAAALLTGLLPHFETVGVLLLAALAAALAVVQGGDRS